MDQPARVFDLLNHGVADAEVEGSANLVFGEAVGLKKEVEGQAVERGAEIGGALAFLGFGGVLEFGQELFDFGHAAADAHGGVEVGKAFAFAGVAGGVELELDRKQGALPVADFFESLQRLCSSLSYIQGCMNRR